MAEAITNRNDLLKDLQVAAEHFLNQAVPFSHKVEIIAHAVADQGHHSEIATAVADQGHHSEMATAVVADQDHRWEITAAVHLVVDAK
jgi:hypothetical protein